MPRSRVRFRRYDLPAGTLHLSSAIPVASGLGSGAAVTLAIVRALSAFAGVSLPLERQSQIVFEVEKIHHGTPSGIDNTVITYGVPIRFQRDLPAEHLQPGAALLLLIADSGVGIPNPSRSRRRARAVAVVSRRDRGVSSGQSRPSSIEAQLPSCRGGSANLGRAWPRTMFNSAASA